MPVSIREQLLAAITSAVSGEYGIPAPETERDLPATIVAEGRDESTEDQYGVQNNVMPVAVGKAVAAVSRDREEMRAQANELLASIIVDMFADTTFGDLADGISYNGGAIQTEIGKFIFAEAEFSVRYHHLRGDPYTVE